MPVSECLIVSGSGGTKWLWNVVLQASRGEAGEPRVTRRSLLQHLVTTEEGRDQVSEDDPSSLLSVHELTVASALPWFVLRV